MTIALDAATLRRLWPRAPQTLADAVAARSASVFAKYGLTTELRVAHFMAQISHESGGGTITEESLNYTTPGRIAQVWPTRFTVESAAAYTRNPQKLANAVYNGRMGNRPGSTDGFDYRGRGLLQITGRESYREIGGLTGLPLEQKPELAFAPTTTLEVAACEFKKLGCLTWCDKDNVEAVTKRVNGGYTGLASRKSWLAKWKRETLEDAPVALLTPPAPPELPRGSDEVLPAGVDHPDKTMWSSRTGWAAALGTITAVGSQVGAAMDAVRPILEDPRMTAVLCAVAVGVGLFIWFDRRGRLKADQPA